MLAGIGAVVLNYIVTNLIWMVLAAIVAMYVVKVGAWIKSHTWAQKILLIADDITHQALAADPNSSLAKFLANTLDKLIESSGVSSEVATRVLTSAFVRAQSDGTVATLQAIPTSKLLVNPVSQQ